MNLPCIAASRRSMSIERSVACRAGARLSWRRLAVCVAVALLMCSCRSNPRAAPPSALPPGATLPAEAFTGGGAPADCYGPQGGMPSDGLPLPYQVSGPWTPAGIATPWPAEEYLRDGGDDGRPVAVSPDWQVHGLDLEDTIAHYDTLDGRTLVEPSNRVHIYAPRFGAVRVVSRLVENEQVNQPGGVEAPAGLARHDDVARAATSLQRLQARGDVSARMAGAYRTRQGDGAVSTTQLAKGFQDHFLPFEDLSLIRHGLHDASQKARLANSSLAAITWSHDQAVQVVLDRQAAVEIVTDERTESVYVVKDLRNSPKLRVVKVASTQLAQPGDTIDFTLRFDNVGDQPLGNIVLMDNLTTRLEFVPDSEQHSIDATFGVERNEGESLVLRWEISEPLEPGQGGIVRFRCRVR